MRKLAIDVGEKSLGVCISDKDNIIAIPLKNYFFERFNFEEASSIILDLLETYKDLDTLIIGYPLKTNGTKTKATEYVEIFLKYLKAKINQDIKIFLFDERFTTKRAEEIIKNKKIDYKKNKDLFAAYVMLTDYLQKV
ncbi:Holliday junction resolvase RuvX [Candidatus Hepatoplasma crinochetorum]|uniref:Holliday junction resolvase RuvX n=1 Tax=Candidatus Hepatoplasma crinochetorum TaxID=295596 RepID=UPI003091339D|nr:MAG: putative pre-16S rRNA nuclease [Candidatus Hepatoplasma crinochetorum]